MFLPWDVAGLCGMDIHRGSCTEEAEGHCRATCHSPLVVGGVEVTQLMAPDAQHLRAMGWARHHVCSLTSAWLGATEGCACTELSFTKLQAPSIPKLGLWGAD